MRNWVRKGLVILLAVSSLFSIARYCQITSGQDKGGKNIAAIEKRLSPVKEMLPFNRGMIGYVADWDVPGAGYATGDMEAEFFVTQYSLAPLIVQRGAVAEWNVAVLGSQAYKLWREQHPDEFEITPLGGNVYIFHRAGNQ